VNSNLVEIPEGKRPLGPSHRCEDNVTMDLTELGWEDVDWIHLAQGMDKWRALVDTVTHLRIP